MSAHLVRRKKNRDKSEGYYKQVHTLTTSWCNILGSNGRKFIHDK